MTTELIGKMKRTGFDMVFWGIETGSQHVVDLMEKRYRLTDARRILRDCSSVGIRQHVPIILGFPGETPEDVVETIEFIFEHKDLPGCIVLLPCQVVITLNSNLHSRPADFGLADTQSYDWRTADGSNTLSLRIARRFVVRQAHGNPTLSMEGLVDTEEILRIDLNDPVISEDLYRMLYRMYERAGKVARFEDAVQSWSEGCPVAEGVWQATGRRLATVFGTRCKPERSCRHTWLALDKDSSDGRATLYSLVLEGLKELNAATPRAVVEEELATIAG